ncbi:MAG: murein biosynthesis integral membrane protein MurJ [Gammaproteobacteria bacterium]|nr:murein biosynthesis integral membrane protein MurJ [Gammaproteobacteria bacterium]
MSKNLLKSTATVGAVTLISRVLGFVRDMVIARLFGAGSGADAFFVAFRIPNFWRRLFAEGSFSQAFVPILTEYKTQRSHAEVQELADRVTGTLGVVLFGMTLIGVVAAPLVVMLFAPGFLDEPERYGMTVEMLRITFPYLLFVSLAALASGVLNTYGRFGVPAFTPVFLNLAMIAAAIWLAPHLERPITALAWGVFLGGLVQLGFQLPYLKKLRLLPRPRWGWKDSGVRRIVKLMIPALFGVSVTQINLLFDTLIASFLVAGSVSWLYYADRLVEFPLGVFGIALATVILPALSQKHTEASASEFSRTLDWALRWVVLIGAPATVGLLLLASPLLTTLFHYGAFSAHDVAMSARSLMAFSIGLTGYIFIKILAPAFYARQDMRTPVRIGVIAMLSNMVLNVILVFPLQHAGLALATALAAFINAGLLYRALRRESVYQPQPGWVKFLLRVLAANAVMALLLWFGSGAAQDWLAWSALTRAAHLALLIGAGAVAYLVMLYLTGVKLKEFFKPAVEQVAPGKAD